MSERRRRHLGEEAGRVFIPQWRMRQIRWEESVAHSHLKRSGKKDVRLIHSTCYCGSLGCVGIPIFIDK